jgi:hypothetical protein
MTRLYCKVVYQIFPFVVSYTFSHFELSVVDNLIHVTHGPPVSFLAFWPRQSAGDKNFLLADFMVILNFSRTNYM